MLRNVTPSFIRLSADCCARFKSKSKRDGRGLERETVNSAGSSIISTSPRRTSVVRVVRGTSSDCSVVSGIVPPEAANVSTSVRWLLFSLPSADFSSAIFMVRVASRGADTSSRVSHFLRTIPARIDFETCVAGRSVCSRIRSDPSGAKALFTADPNGTAEAVPLYFSISFSRTPFVLTPPFTAESFSERHPAR